MKTTTSIIAVLALTLQIALEGQSQNKPSATSTVKVISVPHADYVSQLLTEANSMSVKAEHFRAQADAEDGEKKKKLLKDAAYLDKVSLEKQIEAFEINYALNTSLYSNNLLTIKNLQEKSNSKQNAMHLQFLIKESHKNMRLSHELAEESSNQENLELRLGPLTNAGEKILLALKEQNEAIDILKSNSKLVANK